ncbi:FAV1 [Candida pseudojiufengensis]|uniref:FAV1 n=1 Tax=Candida pseudojiufengensis TaxID=497109 RepID=UPI0022251974|nr:FAV1 [Candida pseudojiufengensis]KAI5965812.1 FAV1 [Candida pseudojiufengensis]
MSSVSQASSTYLLSNSKFVDAYNNRHLINSIQNSDIAESKSKTSFNQGRLYDPFEGIVSKDNHHPCTSNSIDSASSSLIQNKLKKLNSLDSYEVKADDLKFKYKQHLIEFLNYIIGKYKEFEHNLKLNGFIWNESFEKNLVFLNLIKLGNGYKNMIMNLLQHLNSLSTFVDKNLLSCNIFQLVYNSQLDQFRFGKIINESLFTDEFKFNLLSYYYKLNFILSQDLNNDQKWCSIPIEIWFKLPSFIKLIHDDVKLLYSSHFQDLQICLVKLNSISSKFKVVDNLKNKNPIISWTDLRQIDHSLKMKFPDYCVDKYSISYSEIPDDFNQKPLSTSIDNKLVHVNQPNQNFKDKDHKQSSSSISRSTSLKRSLTTMVKRSFSLGDLKGKVKDNCHENNSSPEQPPTRSNSLRQLSFFNKKEVTESLPIQDGGELNLKLQKSQTLQHQINVLSQFRRKLNSLGQQLIQFLIIQLKYVKLWENSSATYPTSEKTPYIKSMYQLFTEKLQNQIQFTKDTVVPLIDQKLICPIDECLEIAESGNIDVMHLNQFIELIVKQYNQLYCDWLEGIIGSSSIKEYERLYHESKSLSGSKPKGDDIILYYNQLLELKNLMS